jgi:hypothetical protein
MRQLRREQRMLLAPPLSALQTAANGNGRGCCNAKEKTCYALVSSSNKTTCQIYHDAIPITSQMPVEHT